MEDLKQTLLMFFKLSIAVFCLFTIGAIVMERAPQDQNEIGVKNGN